jgi:hypothetical protein
MKRALRFISCISVSVAPRRLGRSDDFAQVCAKAYDSLNQTDSQVDIPAPLNDIEMLLSRLSDEVAGESIIWPGLDSSSSHGAIDLTTTEPDILSFEETWTLAGSQIIYQGPSNTNSRGY